MSRQAFVYTMNRTGQVGAWSRYLFPWNIEATALLGEKLYLRSGNKVYVVDENADTDDGEPIEAIVQWPWLDFGQPGVTKMLQSLDVVGDKGDGDNGTVNIQIGYDQRFVEAFTPPYTIPIDTLPGMPIPIPVSAPTLSVRLSFTGKWALQSVNVNLASNRRQT